MTETIGKGILQVGFDKSQVEQAGKEQLLPSAQRIAGDVAGAFAAIKIAGFAKDGIDELKQAQGVMAITEAHIKSTGGAANVTAEQVAGLAGSLSSVSGVDDELIQSGENMLLTFKHIRNEVGEGNDIFDKATAAALDLSKSGFGSVESASVLLGKALDDPIKGVTALQRVGVALTDQQKEQVKAFVASGDTLSAQKIILGEVESQVGGTAAAYGKTLPGQLDIAKESFANMKGELVAGMVPALKLGAQGVTFLTEEVGKLPEPLQAVVGITALAGGGIASLARPVSDLVNLYRLWAARAVTAAAATESVAAAEAALATNSAAAVGGLYAVEGATIASGAAFGPWGIAAAGAIIAASQAIDIWGGKTSYELAQVADLAQATGRDLVESFDFDKNEANPGDFAKQLDLLVHAGTTGIGVLQRYRDQLVAEKRDTTEVDAALESAKAAQSNMNDATETGSEVAGGYAAALQAVNDTLHASADPVFAYEKALIANRQAQVDATTAMNDGKHSADEIATAQINAATSALAVQDAQIKLSGAMHDNPALAAQVTQGMKDLHDQGYLTDAQFWTLAGTIESIPKDPHITLVADTAQAEAALARVQARVNDINLVRYLTGGSGIGSNAAGTDNWKGGPTWLAEQGAELVLSPTIQNLPRGAQVISNDRLHELLGAGSPGAAGGPLVHIEHASFDTQDTVKDLNWFALTKLGV